MKKLLLSLTVVTLLASCGGAKSIEKELSSGNYDQAINNSLEKLKTNKDKKRKADYIYLLKDAFNKVVDRDLETIAFLKKDGNPSNLEKIYETYTLLDARQERIKPILPLYVNGKEIRLPFSNYNKDIIDYKNKTSNHLYNNAKTLLLSNNKIDIRKAYEDLEYLQKINPNYKDVRQLMDQAHYKGTDFVVVAVKNQTQQVIPKRLESELLIFSTCGLNNFWTAYHSTKEDSLGNKIKVDKFITVRCEYYESKQLKSSYVRGNVVYKDLRTNQNIDTFPLESEFVFEHIYATSRGDRRALDRGLIGFLNNRRVNFPSNEQMIYDTGEDLKIRLKEIITGQRFR